MLLMVMVPVYTVAVEEAHGALLVALIPLSQASIAAALPPQASHPANHPAAAAVAAAAAAQHGLHPSLLAMLLLAPAYTVVVEEAQLLLSVLGEGVPQRHCPVVVASASYAQQK
jgi:hypothetical protein